MLYFTLNCCKLATRLASHHGRNTCDHEDGLFARLYLVTEVIYAKYLFCGVAQGPYRCTVLSCTATRDSEFGQKPVTRPPWRSKRIGGTAGYHEGLLTI